MITDPQLYCEQEFEASEDGTSIPNVIAIAYPPDEESRYSVDGIVIVLVAGWDGSESPDGSVLRMSAG